MDNWKIRQTVDLSRSGSGPAVWPEALMLVGDRKAHTWEITLTDKGGVPDLTGASATGYFNRADSACVPVQGTVVGNIARVTLVNECYTVPGPMMGIFRLSTANGVTMTVSMLRFSVAPGPADSMVDPEHIIPDLDDLLRQIEQMESTRKAAETATGEAVAATQAATEATEAATKATGEAQAATKAATQATADAVRATGDAEAATEETVRAGINAEQQAAAAAKATSEAQAATEAATQATADAVRATGEADAATDEAVRATGEADAAADAANKVANQFSEVGFEVEALPMTSEPTASVEQTDTKTTFKLGVPVADLAYSTFEVDNNMDLLMHSPEGFDDLTFRLNENAELEVLI